MKALYDRMDTLPPRLQMFMAGCPAELEAKRDRISCRQVVMRTVLALAEGVHRTAYWNLAPEYPGPADHLQMMHLLIGKLPLLGYRDGDLAVRHPAAQTFALLAEKMAGARAVSRVTADGPPGLHAFEVDRAGRGPLLVVWDHRDPFDGEDEPPAEVSWPWPAATATVTDVFGRTWTTRCQDGQIRLPVSDTPLFVEPPASDSQCGLWIAPPMGSADIRDLTAAELAASWRASGLGERAVHRQPQVLSVHAAIFASPMNTGPPTSFRVARISARATRSGQQEGDQPEVRGPSCIRCSWSCTCKQTPTRTSRTGGAAPPGPAASVRARPCGSPPPRPSGTAARGSEFWHVR